MKKSITTVCVVAVFWMQSTVPADDEPLPEIGVTLSPGGVDSEGTPSWVDVSMHLSGLDIAGGAAFLMTPNKFAGVAAVPYEVSDLQVSDANGPVPLTQKIDDPDAGGFLFYRRWSADRPLEGDVKLAYRAPIDLVIPSLGSGPPFDLRAAAGGLSGAGSTFMIVPDVDDQPFAIDIEWNLDALRNGSIGVSSHGVGSSRTTGPANLLLFAYYMAGPLGRYPADGEASRFNGFWIGTPRFDALELMKFSHEAYSVIAEFFGDTDPPAFTVMLRGNPYQGGGGAALTNSFLATYPDTREDASGLRGTITHETLHNWVGTIEGPPGSTSWFSEGMVVSYTRLLLFRSGLFTAEEFLEDVNGTATNYYTNALIDLPNDQIAAGFWKDTRIRSLPYTRGSLYFADVDAKIRDFSDGRRSLDDLLKSFVGIRRNGTTVNTDTWLDLISDELGPDAIRDFERMIAGELIVPPDDAFGPCFKRENAELRRFELGFDRSALVTEPRIISGLVKGSGADRAGLRDGDEILEPPELEGAQRDPERTISFDVRRNGRTISVEYLPRGESVDGYRWVRNQSVPMSDCLG